MATRLAIAFLAVGSPLVLVCLIAGGAWAGWGLALLTAGFPVALAVLGAARSGRLGPLVLPMAALFLLLAGSLVAMLLLAGGDAGDARVGGSGLSAGAAVMLVGLGLAPFVLTVAAYAVTFLRQGLRAEDLAKVLAFKRHAEPGS